MIQKKRTSYLILFFLFFSLSVYPPAAKAGTDNVVFARLLKKHVINGRVDYDGFKKDEAELDRYLEFLSHADTASFSEKAAFAFYINAYNAFTIKLILTKYPGIDSIKDIGGFFSGPWDIEFVQLKDKTISLGDIEHKILRPVFEDPRLHFAINCASKSCPPLRDEPYEPGRLDEQLNQQAKDFINADGNIVIKGSAIYISKIFKWFKTDFKDGVILFIRSYASNQLTEKLNAAGQDIKIKYLDYDWSLNQKK